VVVFKKNKHEGNSTIIIVFVIKKLKE